MQFKYTAKDKNGKKVTALTYADSPAGVIASLKKDALLAIRIEPVETVTPVHLKPRIFSKNGKVTSKEITVFSRQLATTLTAGLTLTQSLEAVSEELTNKHFQNIVRDVIKDIEGGASFSQSLTRHQNAFPATYRAIVETGEATGGLDKMMAKVSDYLESADRVKEKVKSALTYPIFLLAFACILLTAIVLFIIPKFKEMFDSARVPLPWLTRTVIRLSEFSIHHWLLLLIFAIVMSIILRMLIKIPVVRFWVDTKIIGVPIVGKNIIHKFLISRFCSTLGILLEGGVSLPTSLKITSQVVNNLLLRQSIEKIRFKVTAGSGIANSMKDLKVFPRLVVRMTAVGERTGRIADMFQRTATYYESELDHTIQRLSVILEPTLIILVGIIIAIIVVALYLPIFSMVRLVK